MNNLSKFGYYKVGDSVYFNKFEALEQATRTSTYPTWHFNDEVFSSFDWTQEPPFSLDEAYRIRAQQLRDKYDYLILFYSGGADSHNILTTFIKNNIKIDSVVIYGTYDFDRDQTNRFNLELYNAAIPFAKQYAHLYDLKLLDISDYFEKYYHSDWIYESGVQLAPYEYTMGYLYKDDYIKSWMDRGSVGFIRGIDKPRVIIKDNEYYLSFLDYSMMQTPSVMLEKSRMVYENTELFYWTPDAPWILAKQAHVIKKYFESNPELKPLLTHTATFSYDTMERYIVPLIYDAGVMPGEKPKFFSLGKGNAGTVYHHKDQWFHSSQTQLKSQALWHKGIDHINKTIDERFKNNGDISRGYVGFWSKWYRL